MFEEVKDSNPNHTIPRLGKDVSYRFYALCKTGDWRAYTKVTGDMGKGSSTRVDINPSTHGSQKGEVVSSCK